MAVVCRVQYTTEQLIYTAYLYFVVGIAVTMDLQNSHYNLQTDKACVRSLSVRKNIKFKTGITVT